MLKLLHFTISGMTTCATWPLSYKSALIHTEQAMYCKQCTWPVVVILPRYAGVMLVHYCAKFWQRSAFRDDATPNELQPELCSAVSLDCRAQHCADTVNLDNCIASAINQHLRSRCSSFSSCICLPGGPQERHGAFYGCARVAFLQHLCAMKI